MREPRFPFLREALIGLAQFAIPLVESFLLEFLKSKGFPVPVEKKPDESAVSAAGPDSSGESGPVQTA